MFSIAQAPSFALGLAAKCSKPVDSASILSSGSSGISWYLLRQSVAAFGVVRSLLRAFSISRGSCLLFGTLDVDVWLVLVAHVFSVALREASPIMRSTRCVAWCSRVRQARCGS